MATGAATLLRRGPVLEYATLGWNVVGTVVVLTAAVAARSVALAGFGLDSLIEIVASVLVVWQHTGTERGRERLALRLIGAAFFALAPYILGQTADTLRERVGDVGEQHEPARPPGPALAPAQRNGDDGRASITSSPSTPS